MHTFVHFIGDSSTDVKYQEDYIASIKTDIRLKRSARRSRSSTAYEPIQEARKAVTSPEVSVLRTDSSCSSCSDPLDRNDGRNLKSEEKKPQYGSMYSVTLKTPI